MDRPNQRRRIIGIDPGIALVGYSVLDLPLKFNQAFNLLQCGVISTSAKTPTWERLKTIREDLMQLLEAFKPEVAVVELVYFSKNVKTAIVVAQARGVILETLAAFGIKEITEFTPTHLKQVLFGNGKASKQEIQMMVSQALNLPGLIRPDDAADATALALAYGRSNIGG